MLQRHNISGSEVKSRHQNVPGYGAMHGAGPRLHRAPRRWMVPLLLVVLLLALAAIVGLLIAR
jgi:hypothetical protein